MSVNLIDRLPVPGSLGAPVDQGIALTIGIDAGFSVAQASIVVRVDSVIAYTTSSFQTGFTGTVTGSPTTSWVVTVVPDDDLPFDSTVTVQVQCTATHAGPDVAFSQTYSFGTVRNIQVSVNAEYIEEGDVINLTIYPNEGTRSVTAVISSGICRVYTHSALPASPPVLMDTYQFVNERNSAASEGNFKIRLLHPMSVTQNMTYSVDLTVDPYQAPNVNTVSGSGTINFVKKTNAVLIGTHKQPYVQGEIHLPRVEYEGRHNSSFQVNEADYEKIDMQGSDQLPDVLVDLEFFAGESFVNVLDGEVEYSGGGNRLLRNLDDLSVYVLQDVDSIAPLINSRTLIEPASTNLFPNSAFLDDPSPFVLSGTDTTVITETTVVPFIVSDEDNETPLVNQIKFVFEGMAVYNGTVRHARATSPSVPYVSGQDVVVSALVRITYRDSTVTLTNFSFSSVFYDNSGSVVHQAATQYAPSDFVSENLYASAEVFVPNASIPPTASSVGFYIDFDSFESCDRIEVFMVGPSIEYGTFSTSRVVSDGITTTRDADKLTISQPKNINVTTGVFVIEYVPMYDGAPPVDASMFDSRLPGTLRNGFYAQHKDDGNVEFSVVDSSGVYHTVSSAAPVALDIGQPYTFKFSWDDADLTIKQGDTVIGTLAGPYTLPNGVNSVMFIGSDSNNQNSLLSEILRFLVYSRPID